MALSVPVAFYAFDALSGQWVGGDLELFGLIVKRTRRIA